MKTTYNDLPHKFEAGTPPIAAGIGLGAAIQFLNEFGMDQIAARENELLEYATSELNKIEGVQIIGRATNKASVISFLLDGIHPQMQEPLWIKKELQYELDIIVHNPLWIIILFQAHYEHPFHFTIMKTILID